MDGKRKLWKICMVFVLAIIFFVVFYIYYQNNEIDDSKQGTLIMEARPDFL